MSLKLEPHQGTRVVLIRHGQSTYNVLGLYQGCSDESTLTDKGRDAAIKTGTYLKGLAFDAIYTSPLQRAQETAREILKAMSPTIDPNTIHISDLLKETNLPMWEGLSFNQVRAEFPDKYRTWKQRPHEFCMELPSSPPLYFYPALDLYRRVQQFWQETLPRHIGETILIVAHGGTNRALIHTAIGVTPDRYHDIEQSNCGVSIIDFPNGCLDSGQLVGVNITSQLEEDLPQRQEGLRLIFLSTQSTPEKQIQNLLQSIEEIGIDFTLCTETDNDRASATLETNFQPISTGLVIGCDRIVKHFLNQAVGLNPEQLQRLRLYPETVSFLHYPEPHQNNPILQGMNVSINDKHSLFKLLKNKNSIHNTF